MDLRLLRHGAAGVGLPLLLSHKLRAVPGLPGEVGPGRALAEEGSQPVEQEPGGGERGPGSDPARGGRPLPAQTQPEGREPQPNAAALQHVYRMVSGVTRLAAQRESRGISNYCSEGNITELPACRSTCLSRRH